MRVVRRMTVNCSTTTNQRIPYVVFVMALWSTISWNPTSAFTTPTQSSSPLQFTILATVPTSPAINRRESIKKTTSTSTSTSRSTTSLTLFNSFWQSSSSSSVPLFYSGRHNGNSKSQRHQHRHRSRRALQRIDKLLLQSTSLSSSSSSFDNNNNHENNKNTSQNNTSYDLKNITTLEGATTDVNSIEWTNDATNQSSTMPFIPSYRTLFVFTMTTILIWISEPLLSLVDTTIVGMTAATTVTSHAKSVSAVVQIAALGPATTLFDSSIYMTYFLAIATTNLISPALATKDWKQLRRSTSHLMGLAVCFGSLVTLFCFGLGKQVITGMVGSGNTAASATAATSAAAAANNGIVPLATMYAWIRAAVAPFCVVDFVAQSFCLAILDTKTPAIAVAVASLINIVGDLLLSPRWGIQGAAVATAMATVSSCLILVRKVKQQVQEWKVKQEQEEEHEQSRQPLLIDKMDTTNLESTKQKDSTDASSSSPHVKTEVVDGSIEMVDDGDKKDRETMVGNKRYKDDANNNIPFFSLPDRQSLVDLFQLAGPIFFVMMGKIACYSILTVRATHFGILPLAAHNIMMRVFFFFSCFGDSLSQAAQTFIPQVTSPKAQGKLLKRLFVLSTGVGLAISNASYFILTKLGSFLTKDAAIIQQMATYAPYVASAVVLHPYLVFMEGAILARRDLTFLVVMYAITMTFHIGMVMTTQSFQALWQVFFVFQAIRLAQFGGRFFQQQRNVHRGTQQDDIMRMNSGTAGI